MQLTNYTFFNSKNLLYINSVKGLRGYGLSYRFQFNGQEKDDEVAGAGNSYTAEFWQFNPRLGRRFNLDPIVKYWESGYATYANNPLILVDPKGLDVINGDAIRRDKSANNINNLESKIKSLEDKFGTSKKEFKLNGGTGWKESWKGYKKDIQYLKSEKRWFKEYSTRAVKTQEIIDKWKISSPKIFEDVNNATNELGQKVNFVLGVKDAESNVWGRNNVDILKVNNDQTMISNYIPTSEEFGDNNVAIFIDPKVRLFTQDPETGQFSLNHEGGHFLYWTKFTSLYNSYLNSLTNGKFDLKGGHNPDDKSGIKAIEYGNCNE